MYKNVNIKINNAVCLNVSLKMFLNKTFRYLILHKIKRKFNFNVIKPAKTSMVKNLLQC